MFRRKEKECGKILTLGGAAESCMAPEKQSKRQNVWQN